MMEQAEMREATSKAFECDWGWPLCSWEAQRGAMQKGGPTGPVVRKCAKCLEIHIKVEREADPDV